VCRITGNLSNLSGALERKIGQHGNPYWYLEFEVCIRFGGTELEAYLEWKEYVSKLRQLGFALLINFINLGSYSYRPNDYHTRRCNLNLNQV
jgi:hypothetical protein